MDTTRELLTRALNMHPAKHWCDRYEIKEASLSQAKKRGRLSPILAGNLAIDLGEDAKHWITVAALETERNYSINKRLRQALNMTKP